MAKLNWNDCTIEPQSALFGWATDKAVSVHEGQLLENGRFLPARRWTDVGLFECDPKESFIEHFEDSPVEAFRQMANELNDAFTSAIESPLYSWPNATLRSNGVLATSPRNIVDTGELQNSQYLILSEGS